MKVDLLYPIGFCKGVQNAINIAIDTANKYVDLPIYCIGSIVHNQSVNEELAKKNIKILNGDKKELIDSINKGVVIFSAHGISPELINYAKNKNLIVIDTVCPYVEKSIDIIKSYLSQNYKVIFIGVNKHPETVAICSLSKNIFLCTGIDDIPILPKSDKIIVTNQTTLSIDDLEEIHKCIKDTYPFAIFADEICNSTRIRQKQIKDLDSQNIDGIIIVGDKMSNNTKSLFKLALNKNIESIMVQNINEINFNWLNSKKHICIASGASTPIEIVMTIYKSIKIHNS